MLVYDVSKQMDMTSPNRWRGKQLALGGLDVVVLASDGGVPARKLGASGRRKALAGADQGGLRRLVTD